MKRLLLVLIPVFTLLTLLSLSEIVLAGPAFQEGKAYKRIVPEQPTSSVDKIEVVELFWYSCPHCHRFQPYVEKWLENKPDNIVYIQMPAILNESWALLARAFYTAQALGKLEEIHQPMFYAIHNEKRKLNTEQALSAFFAEFGVLPEDFRKAFHSFSVDNKVRRARSMTKRYQTQGTPTVIINGKYRTDPGMANGFTNMIGVIDYLTEIEKGGQS